MSRPRRTGRVSGQMESVSTTYVTKLLTRPIFCYGATTARITDEIQGLIGNYRHKGQFRTADVSMDFPDNTWNLAGLRNTNGVTSEDVNIPANKIWLQGGLAVSASSGAGEAYSAVDVEISGTGEIVATQRIEINPDLNSGTAFIPLGDPFEVLGLNGIIFAYVFTRVNGTVSIQPAIRYFDRLDLAGDFATVGSVLNQAADGMSNSGDIAAASLSIPTNPPRAFAQAGIAITSTNARATLDVLVGARW